MAAVREDRKLSSARVWIGRLGSQFRREASGTVAVLFGTLLVPVLFLLGAALDCSRSLEDRGTLQRAADAAVLAAAREQVPDSQRATVADQVFTGEGTNDMVAKIADAIAAKMAVPMVSR